MKNTVNPLIEKAARIYASLYARNEKQAQKDFEYFVKEYSGAVELTTGQILTIEKPRIETSFCFGWSSMGQGMEFDEASECADNARKSVKMFIDSNMKDFQRIINLLSGMIDSEITSRAKVEGWTEELSKAMDERWSKGEPYAATCYWKDDQNRIVSLQGVKACRLEDLAGDVEQGKLVKLTREDIDRIRKAYEEEARKFEKRLATYLKKYGLSKLNVWTYWVDE